MLLAQMGNEIDTKSRQAVFVRNDNGADMISKNTINHREKLLTFEIEPPADFFYPLINDEATSVAKLLEATTLGEQIRLLRCAGDTAVSNHPFLGVRHRTPQY